MTIARAIEQLNSRDISLLQLQPLKCNFIICTPKSAQNSLNSMTQLQYDNDHDPVSILTILIF
jgi:hypothetical protein